MNESNPAWLFFAALQCEADPRSIDLSLAREEALDAVLDEVVADPSLGGDLITNRFHSLCRNRLSKHTHRRAIDSRRFRSTHRRGGTDLGSIVLMPPAPSVFDQVAYAQLTDLVRTVLPAEDFSFLLDIADGQSYSDMARARQKTVSSLKAKVFRVRQKVQNSRISPILRSWPRR